MIHLSKISPRGLADYFTHSSRVAYFCGVLVIGCQFLNAAIVNSDGDFSAQTVNTNVSNPWNPVGGDAGQVPTVTEASQSPFQNAYLDNAKGSNVVVSSTNPFYVNFFPAIAANSTAPLYFNIDFRNTSNAETGDYSITVGAGASGARLTTALYVSGNSVFAQSDTVANSGASLLVPELNVWYNAQLTLDMQNNTYSGVVTREGTFAQTAISSRPFITEDLIEHVYTDGGTNFTTGTAPSHNLDNWGLSTTPFLPANQELQRSPIVTVDFNGNGGPALNTTTIGTAQLPAGNGQAYNNVSGISFSNVPLVDHNGLPTGITISGSSPVQDPSTVDSTNAGTTAFQDALVTLGPGIGASDGSQSTGSVTLNGLDNALTYDLYLFGYFNNADVLGANRETGSFTINGLTQSTTGADTNAGFVLGQDYVLFSDVAPVLGAISISFTDNTPGRRVGVFNGLQLVAIPEPTSLMLAGLGLACVMLTRKRAAA